MIPDVVVDIGNSRLKCGRCTDEPGIAAAVAMPTNPESWERLTHEWNLPEGSLQWSVASVNPQVCEQFISWAKKRGGSVFVFDHWTQLGLPVKADPPEGVGLDRLFNILAVRALVEPGHCAIVADIGTAVTVDLLDQEGAFAGGSIFPGIRLMANALHAQTAALPLVDVHSQTCSGPGLNTEDAIRNGIKMAVAGGVDALIIQLAAACANSPTVYLTGGDAAPLRYTLAAGMNFHFHVRPLLTLEGIRLAAEALP